jgi:biofilm PGA synthesis N-glycosyltransferase PgaC
MESFVRSRELVLKRMNGSKPKYVIITPAYNESRFISQTAKGVISQTIIPVKWIIVDDGSTDNTAEIVKQYANNHHFIEFYSHKRRPEHTYYESNVYAILEGYDKVKGMDFEYLAILDADITLCENYYEEIFARFDANAELGIATGILLEEIGGRMKELVFDRYSTPKAFQVFRHKCYEQIGGFIPCKNGGEDSCAEIMARMYGWQTWSFTDIKAIHQRPVGIRGARTLLKAKFNQGLTDYCVGTYTLFMLAKCFRRAIIERPYLFSGLARMTGFLYGYLSREKMQLPISVRKYIRREQFMRLCVSAGIKSHLWKPIRSRNNLS